MKYVQNLYKCPQIYLFWQNSPTVNAFLIDIGEIINVAIDVFHWYHLPRDLQQVAPQAIACELHKVNIYIYICNILGLIKQTLFLIAFLDARI